MTMELLAAKKLAQKYMGIQSRFISETSIAERYYRGDNDILYQKKDDRDCPEECPNPLRNADNRIPFNFHGLLVDQKASYMFTAPPLFDVQDDGLNKVIADTLGDAYAKKAKRLCVDASNCGVAWLHYWSDVTKGFCYGVVPAAQIYPVFSNLLDFELQAVMRTYTDIDENGEEWQIFEFWNDKECAMFQKKGDAFLTRNAFTVDIAGTQQPTNIYKHNMGAVPFIAFPNNNIQASDLKKIKPLIDAYDKTFSGFMNDIEDVQEVIFILTNYGGQDLKEFLSDLKYYKTIQVDNDGDGDKSGVSTLTIDIPVEARTRMLELTRKAIFDMGQGIDPQQQGLDRTSGEAMKFLYSLLELKAGLMETEFKLGFGELVRAICRFHGREVRQITQTWTRSAIRNDSELVDMCQKSVGVISQKTILANHPFVENVEDEEKRMAEEKEEQTDAYSDLNAIGFKLNSDDDDEGEGQGE